MSTTIESLQIEILSSSQNASNGLDALSQSLDRLKTATKGGLGLTAVSKQISKLGTAVNSINSSATNNLTGLANAIQLLSGVKVPATIGKNITAITTALSGLKIEGAGNALKIQELVTALEPLSQMPKQNISQFITQLNKIPDMLEGLNNVDMDAFRTKILEVTDAVRPLATEMEKVAAGFAAFPAKIQKLLNATDKIPDSNKKAAASFTDFSNKMKLVVGIIKTIGKSIWSVIDKSNDYVENMNLFSVAMGEYASKALDYAETVSDAMGIDTSEWIRAQGVFMTMATGFGVASDRAAKMSENLTQLGYDLSSFYNIDIETAMLKLKSGLAGELEPLRAIGYDLSQAKLEATAAALGITKTVDAMTQAEKAQLRYYAIMTQVTTAQGDMARTLDDPANQIRVLKQQFSMAAREIGNVFIPALNAILPYAIALVKVVRTLASNLASLFDYEMPEVDYSGVSAMSIAADETGDAMDEAQKSAKKLKQYMMGFDELNIINPNTEDTSGGLGEFDFELPEYDFLKGLVESDVDEITTKIQGVLDEVGMIVAGATLALGAVLAFTGVNVPLGVMLMAGGAYSLATQVALNWNSMDDPMKTTLGTIEGIIGGGLLALGGVLAFSGVNVPLGIALMAMGAVSLVSAVALNWEGMSESVSGVLGTITGIVGASLLALGAIMAFSGANIPLGIALMAGGAVSLVTAATLNWEGLTSDIESCVTTLGTIVGGAALVVGAVLAFTGANVPLGVALMATGALSMGTAIALNTNLLSDEVKNVVAGITSVVSVALLAVGAVLAISGVNMPLGIALMAGGALAMGTAIVPNWNALSSNVQGVITGLLSVLSPSLLVIGAILAFSGANVPLGIGLMLAGVAGIGTAATLNWDSLVDTLRGKVGGITAIVSGALLALGAILAFTGVGIPLGIGLMLTGAAGLVSVIAINWDSIITSIGNVIKNIGNEIAKFINWIIGGINNLFHIQWDAVVVAGVQIIPAVDMRLVNIPKLPTYAEGGFPQQGQMFIANEAGPEMVGNIGRRTAVANNDQIVESISVGVAEANSEQNMLLREQNSLLRQLLEKDSGVYLDGRSLSNSVDKYKREQGRVLIAGGVL